MLSSVRLQRKAGRVDCLAAKQVEVEQCYWRLIVTWLIDFLILLPKGGLALGDEIIDFVPMTITLSITELNPFFLSRMFLLR